MSAQVAPMDGGLVDGNGSTASSDHAEPPPPPKHVCSRFLKKHPPDLYGQKHAIESAKCVNNSLRLLEKEIWKLDEERRRSLEMASVRCPGLYESKEHRLLFLRCEQFNVDVSDEAICCLPTFLAR